MTSSFKLTSRAVEMHPRRREVQGVVQKQKELAIWVVVVGFLMMLSSILARSFELIMLEGMVIGGLLQIEKLYSDITKKECIFAQIMNLPKRAFRVGSKDVSAWYDELFMEIDTTAQRFLGTQPEDIFNWSMKGIQEEGNQTLLNRAVDIVDLQNDARSIVSPSARSACDAHIELKQEEYEECQKALLACGMIVNLVNPQNTRRHFFELAQALNEKVHPQLAKKV